MAVLDFLLAATQPMTLAEIADGLGLDHSSALRLLRALEELGRVIRLPDGRKYACSPQALRPLSLLHPIEQLRRDAAPLISALAAQIRQSVVLVVFFGQERCVVDVALSPGSLSPYYSTWLHGPLHGSGPGKCLLMSLDEPRRRALLGPEPYRAHTPTTLTSWDDVSADLAAATERGYAIVRDEFYDGLSAVAAPFSGWSGRPLGCIAATGHSRNLTDEAIASTGPEVARVARLIPLQAASLRLLEPFAP
tara:strand:- start:67 stop:816 length:750 start_codon:yes stop_codon:yes gene_type:complete